MSKQVLITGVSSGIGKATAKLFQDNGWDVIGIDINGASSRYCTHFIKADISNPDEVLDVFENFKSKYGRLDAVVNNAAIQICKSITDTTLDEWDKTLNTNLRSVFLITKYAIPFLKKRKGAIVNISSVHAIATSPSMSAYATSKGAITAFTRSCAVELGKYNIRVNAILPGAVNTNMLKDGLSRGHIKSDNIQDSISELAAKHLLGNIGNPTDIAGLIYFLSNPQSSSYITGQCFTIDGGATIKLSTE